jgi:acyl-CoA synthetase (NDP forming)
VTSYSAVSSSHIEQQGVDTVVQTSAPRHRLAPLLAPRSVVVIGASPRPGALGNNAVRNLAAFGFTGQIYPLHPNAPDVCGLKAYRDLASLPEIPDCALVAISADKAIPALSEAAERGVKAAVIFASGFSETGTEGRARQEALEDLAQRTGLVVCGPNCLGLINIGERVALYSAAVPEAITQGNVAVLSHSGSGCILLSNIKRLGLSHLISAGNSAVADMGDYLDFLAEDEQTRVAALFIEAIRDPARFAGAARKMRAAGKAVVALKVGRSMKGAAATAAHTGSLAGSDAAYGDFFKRCGVIAVDDLDELVESVALMQTIRRRPKGKGIGIVNVSGGEVALNCDIAQRIGLDLPELSAPIAAQIQAALPSFGTASNPLDATGTAVFDHVMYRACIEGLAADPAISLVAVSQDSPLDMGPRQAATYRALASTAADVAMTIEKPLVFYSNIAAGFHSSVAEPLVQAGVPVLQGARASLLAIRRLVEDEGPVKEEACYPHLHPDPFWTRRLATGDALTEREAKTFLAAHGIPVTRERFARSSDEAVDAANAIGYPVVLKVESADIPHKSDVGGVKLALRTNLEVADAFSTILTSVRAAAPGAQVDGVVVQQMVAGGTEVLVGLSRHDPFGMAVVVGAGGVLVELIRDTALALAPIGNKRALELINETRIGQLLRGYRGRTAADIEALAGLLATLSQIAVAYGDLLEAVDLNPVIVGDKGTSLCVVDALVVARQKSH